MILFFSNNEERIENYSSGNHSVYVKTKLYSLLFTDPLYLGTFFISAGWNGLDSMSKANLTVF
jgi:hypothetical protein